MQSTGWWKLVLSSVKESTFPLDELNGVVCVSGAVECSLGTIVFGSGPFKLNFCWSLALRFSKEDF